MKTSVDYNGGKIETHDVRRGHWPADQPGLIQASFLCRTVDPDRPYQALAGIYETIESAQAAIDRMNAEQERLLSVNHLTRALAAEFGQVGETLLVDSRNIGTIVFVSPRRSYIIIQHANGGCSQLNSWGASVVYQPPAQEGAAAGVESMIAYCAAWDEMGRARVGGHES